MKYFIRKILFYILRIEAQMVLWRYRPHIVTVTGSVGKTSTKDAVYAVLSKFTHVRKSAKSYNSEIGLPLTILGCPNGWSDLSIWFRNILKGLYLIIVPHKYPKWLVLEVGVGKPGDMARTALWLKSDVVIVTAIGETPAHIEFFNSRKHLVEEKSGLIKTLKKDGFLVLNRDDETVFEMKSKTKARVLTYGFSSEADVVASELKISSDKSGVPEGLVFRVDAGGSSLPVFMDGVFGKNHAYASLAAIAVAYGMKENLVEATSALEKYDLPPGRMRLLKGINNSLIIDDTYNSSPTACESAIRTLSEVSAKRKIAVLGDMLELGKHTILAHKGIGSLAYEHADFLVVVGPRASSIREGAEESGMKKKNIYEFINAREAGDFMFEFIKSGDLVLVKGSQGMRMERVVEKILKDQDKKSELLVRQDKEWLAKE